MENNMRIHQKSKNRNSVPSYSPSRYLSKELKISYYSDICMPMFIVVQVIISKSQKQSIYPTADEWVKEMCTYLYIIECNSAIHKDKSESSVRKCMQLETIL